MKKSYDGILLLYKPAGLTSHDCVNKMRKLLRTKKIGHTGTLDPDVTGILPLCIGRATKVAEYMLDYSKTYEATITLGVATTTEDATGEIIAEQSIDKPLRRDEIQAVLKEMHGNMVQVPPMYSAVRVKGKRLYEYALEGKDVERPRREVTIHQLELLSETDLSQHNRSFNIRVHCSKGTYIRTLAVDIGKKLGYPAHLKKMERVKTGPFSVKNSYTFAEIEKALVQNELHEKLLPIDAAVAHFEKHIVPDNVAYKVENGAILPSIKNMENKHYTIYNTNEELLAIYIPHPTKPGLMKPDKMIKVKEN